MINRSRVALALLATALITSCASQAILQIRSEPQGAYITDDDGELLGIAPVDLSYRVDPDSSSCIDTGGFSARWVSGAETFIEPVVLCEAGYASTLIKRDMSKPGLAEDMEFAVEAELLELERAETRAAESSARADWATAAAIQDAAWGWRFGPFYRGPFVRGSFYSGYPYYSGSPSYYDGRRHYDDSQRGGDNYVEASVEGSVEGEVVDDSVTPPPAEQPAQTQAEEAPADAAE